MVEYDDKGESGAAAEPRLILFDCDGTLMDSHHHIVVVMQQAFADCSLQPPETRDVGPVIGLALSVAIERLLPDADADLLQAVERRYRELYHSMPSSYGLFPAVRETLSELGQRGYWLGVVTGKSHAGLLRALEDFDLGGHFLVLRTSDHCPSKPHPAMVQECMDEMGVGADRTTVVGDALLDMQMAKAGGVRALGVSFGVGEAQALIAAGATDIVDDFADLLEYFPPLQSACTATTMRP